MPDYTDPKLRERLKAKIIKSDKGGRAGQWSARKAQLLAQAYKKEGGGYRGGKGKEGKSLEKWGKEKWTTADGGRARRAGGTTRYLPKKAWDKLTPTEKKATQKAKRAGSQDGDQFVANTPAAKRARAKVTKATAGGKKKRKTGKASKKKATAKKAPATKKVAKKKSASAAKKAGGKKKTSAAKKVGGKKKTASAKNSRKKAGGAKVRRKKTASRSSSKKTRASKAGKKKPAAGRRGSSSRSS